MRERELLTLAEAVRGMTSLPATVFRMKDRGLVAEGRIADLLVVDEERFGDTATYEDPHSLAEGIVHALVAGVFAIEDGEATGALAGEVLTPLLDGGAAMKKHRAAIAASILELVGDTPLVRLRKLGRGLPGRVAVKLESFNPGGSVKDRLGIALVEDAERSGALKPGGTIVEATSGNTGMGLALVAAVRGYLVHLRDAGQDQRGEARRPPGAGSGGGDHSHRGRTRRPAELLRRVPAAGRGNRRRRLCQPVPQPGEPRSPLPKHRGPSSGARSAPEIHTLVCGLGTGGTVSGTGRFLKERNREIRVVGADPVGSLYTEYFRTGKLGEAHTYKVEGIGEDLPPLHDGFQRGGRRDPGGGPGVAADDPPPRPKRGAVRGRLDRDRGGGGAAGGRTGAREGAGRGARA